jgi:hypothetical protein
MRPKARPTPTDQAADAAWDKIMAIAEEHALIVQSYGGVATLAVPVEQRKAGIRDRCLRAAGCEGEG